MPAPGDNLRINSARLWDSLMEMAKIGPGVAGGNNRQTLTDADGEGRHLFAALVQGGGHDHGRRHHGQHVRHAGRDGPCGAAGLHGLASRHPADRGQV